MKYPSAFAALRALLVLLLSCLPGSAGAQYHHLGYGEPYELAGKRMVSAISAAVRP